MQRHAVHDGGHAEFAHAIVDGGRRHQLCSDHGARRVKAQVGRALVLVRLELSNRRCRPAARQTAVKAFQRQLAGLCGWHGLALRPHHGVHGYLGKLGRQIALHAAGEFRRSSRGKLCCRQQSVFQAVSALWPLAMASTRRTRLQDHREGRVQFSPGFAGQLDFSAPRFAVGLAVLARLGLPLPMWVLQMMSGDVGLISGRHGVSPPCRRRGRQSGYITFQPADTKRRAVLSANQGPTWPSMEMPLSSYRADQLVQLPGACQRNRFLADAFHQTKPSPRKA